MSKFANHGVLPRAAALAVLAIFSAGAAGVAFGDDTPPPSDNPPHGGRHNNDPAWTACKKQADDQKLQPGDARHEFMKTCMKSAKSANPPPAN
jgi:psiF repeat